MALNIALPVERPVSAGEPMALGALPVTVIPPPGARLDASKTSPSNDTVQFLVGDVTYWLHARRWSGSLDEFTTKVRDERRSRQGFQRMEDERDITTQQGVPGRGARYTMTDRSGRYVVFLSEGIAVWVLVVGGTQGLDLTAADIEASITIGKL